MLDNYSLMLMCGFVSFMCALLWFAHSFAFPHKNKPALLLAVFCFLVSLGFVFYTLRKEGNYIIGWYASDICFYIGLLCAQLGVQRFFSDESTKQMYVCVFLILLQIIYRINENTYSAALMLSCYMVYCVLCTVLVIKNNTSKADKKIFIFTLAPLCVSAVLMSIRVTGLILKPELHTVDLTTSGHFNTLVVFSFMIALVGLNSSYLTVSLGSIISKGEKLSYQDPLTKLANRKKFNSIEAPSSTVYSMVLFKIDQLSSVNKEYGFKEGDQLLKSFGKWASQHVGTLKNIQNNAIFRLNGNEFLMVINEANPQKISACFQEFSKEFESHFVGNTLSAGFAITNVTKNSFEEVYEKARQALEKACSMGGGKTALTI